MFPIAADSFSSDLTGLSDLTGDAACPATVRMLVKPTDDELMRTKVSTLRVLHVVNGEHFSGAERVQSHLGRCLPNQGVIADFACVKPGRFADMLDERSGCSACPSSRSASPNSRSAEQDDGGNEYWGWCHRVPMRGRMDLFAARRLAVLVRENSYKILHAHTPRTAMLAALASKQTGVPWIYHVHSPASRDCDRMLTNRVNAWIERQSLSNCSHIICVSNSLREDLIRQGFAAEKITVVHNGVPAVRPPRDTRPVVGEKWTIGMIALMRNRKGLEVVLDALSEVRGRGLDVALRCIGPFETEAYRKKIDAQISELGIGPHIDWLGFTDDVPSELARLDAMVLPSLFGEGLPMVVLEAMAAAVPVIATRVEGTPEAIAHGVEGLLAEPRDFESLANQIEALVTGEHDWQTMSDAAAKRHGECFSDHAMAERTADTYRRVISR